MPTVSEAVAGGDWSVDPPAVELAVVRADHPEWHSLRLFGGGRHRGVFDAGVETGRGF